MPINNLSNQPLLKLGNSLWTEGKITLLTPTQIKLGITFLLTIFRTPASKSKGKRSTMGTRGGKRSGRGRGRGGGKVGKSRTNGRGHDVVSGETKYRETLLNFLKNVTI